MSIQSIVCAGEAMLEMAAVAGREGHYAQGFAGDTLNTAIYLARAGLHVDYLTKLGDDEFSSGMINLLRQEGVGTGMISRLPGRQPGLYLIRNDADGERHFTYWRDGSPARELFDETVQLPNPDVFYFTGITLAVTRSGHDNLLSLLEKLNADGCRIVFDPNYRPRLWRSLKQARQHYRSALPFCHTVMPTFDDDKELWDFKSPEDCRSFYSEYNVAEVVIKAPDLNVQAYSGTSRQHRQALAVAAVDTTGAGDAFNAGYLAARLAGRDLGAALTEGQDLAARVVCHSGAIIPRESDATT